MAATGAETGQAGARAQALLMGRGNRGAVRGVLPVYRRMSGAASCRVGDSVAEIELNEAVCHIAASNLIPGFLPRSWGSRSFGNCTLSIGDIGPKWTMPALEIALCQSGRPGRDGREPKPGILAGQPLSLRPRPPQTAWAKPRTGMLAAADGRVRSCGQGCAGRVAASLVVRRCRTTTASSKSSCDSSIGSFRWRSSFRPSGFVSQVSGIGTGGRCPRQPRHLPPSL